MLSILSRAEFQRDLDPRASGGQRNAASHETVTPRPSPPRSPHSPRRPIASRRRRPPYGVMLRGGPRSVFNLENIRLLTSERFKI
jgi:hypothetical protein